MDTHEAALTLADVERVRARTRGSLHSVWYPLVVFGALTLAGTALATFSSNVVTSVFSLVGFFAGIWTVNRYYAQRYGRVGAGQSGRPYRIAWIAYLVGGTVVVSIVDIVSGVGAALVAQGVVFALFYGALARLTYSRLLAVIGIGVAVTCIVVVAIGPAHEISIVRFLVGTALVACGLYARELDTAP